MTNCTHICLFSGEQHVVTGRARGRWSEQRLFVAFKKCLPPRAFCVLHCQGSADAAVTKTNEELCTSGGDGRSDKSTDKCQEGKYREMGR